MSLVLKRPKTLAKAARAGAALYRRDRDLSRLAPTCLKAGRKALIARLRGMESACEDERKAGAADYSLDKHLRILSALLAEARGAEA